MVVEVGIAEKSASASPTYSSWKCNREKVCETPPKHFDKLWVAVRLSGGPLRNREVDRSSPLRSRPEDLPEVLGDDLGAVLAACVQLVEDVRDIFNEEVNKPGSSVVNAVQKKNKMQTRAFMTVMLDLLENKTGRRG